MQQHGQSSNERLGGSRRYLFTVAVLALGVMAMTMGAARAARATTPFKASVSGTVAPTGPGSFALTASGHATMLGLTAYSGSVQITNTDSNGVLTDVLTETLTAANGDTLTLLCQETATPLSPGVYHGVDQWTVVGGTGRFANASGSGTGSTDVDLNANTFSKTSSGDILVG